MAVREMGVGPSIYTPRIDPCARTEVRAPSARGSRASLGGAASRVADGQADRRAPRRRRSGGGVARGVAGVRNAHREWRECPPALVSGPAHEHGIAGLSFGWRSTISTPRR